MYRKKQPTSGWLPVASGDSPWMDGQNVVTSICIGGANGIAWLGAVPIEFMRKGKRLPSSAGTLLGVALDESLGKQYQTKDLSPFRDDVSDDRSPLGLGVHPG